MTMRAVVISSLFGLSLLAADSTVLFQDTFRAKLGDGWKWIRESPADWRVGVQGLEVCIRPGNMWGPANDAHNLLVRPAPRKVDLEITASITNHPTHQYEQVDLVWYYDDGHMVKVGQELVDGKLSVVMGREENDKTRTISITPIDADTVELRLQITEGRIAGFFKMQKGGWQRVGACTPPANGQPSISLMFYQGAADVRHWARVSELTIRSLSKD